MVASPPPAAGAPPGGPRRFFVGLTEIGDTTLLLARGLRERGHEVANVVTALRSPLLARETRHDRYLPESPRLARTLARAAELVRQAPARDVFVFNFGESFLRLRLPWLGTIPNVDLPLLAALGRRIVFLVNGDDLRSYDELIADLRAHGLDAHARHVAAEIPADLRRPDPVKRRRAASISRWADVVFARPLAAQRLTRGYHLFWVSIDLSTTPYGWTAPDPPVVVHAPSDSGIKGTRFVLDAVARLAREGIPFRFVCCEGRDNREVRALLHGAHVAIDQLVLPGYGLFAVEAMASGCAVVGSVAPAFNRFPPECPIVRAGPESLADTLRALLRDPGRQAALARAGREYVERYHDYRVVTDDFLRRLDETPAGGVPPC